MNIVNYCLDFLKVLLEQDNICSLGQGLPLQHAIAYNMCLFAIKKQGIPSFSASLLLLLTHLYLYIGMNFAPHHGHYGWP